jgi:protein kinase-like protein
MSHRDPKRSRDEHSDPEIAIGVAPQPEPEHSDTSSSLTGERFAKYMLVGEIAQGGMGELFLAIQDGLEGFRKIVVVKRVLRHLTANAEFMRMFIDEARLTARLEHPNIVKTFEFGEQDGQYFTVMEFLAGEDLGKVLRKLAAVPNQLMPLPFAVHIIVQLCNGLHFAHELTDLAGRPLGLVHRDVNPSNIIITYAGEVKMIDFGVAKVNTTASRTVAGTIKGKIAYMAPEHILARPVDRRSDVFSTGIVLWELLTGRPLFARDNEAATLHAVLYDPIPPPSKYRPEVPTELDAIVARAVARAPGDRFESADDMQAALEELGGKLPKVDGRALGRMMEGLFGFTRAQANRSIAQARSLAHNIALVMNPRTEVIPRVDTRSEVNPHGAATGTASTVENHRLEPAAPVRGKHARLVIGAGVAAVLGAAAIAYTVVPGRTASAPPSAALPGPPTESPERIAEAARGSAAVPAARPAPPAVAEPQEPAAAPAISPPQAPVRGTLSVATHANAVVYLDGVAIEHGSFSDRPTASGAHELVVKIPGRTALKQRISIEEAHATRVELPPPQRPATAATTPRTVATSRSATDEPHDHRRVDPPQDSGSSPDAPASPRAPSPPVSHDPAPIAAPPVVKADPPPAPVTGRPVVKADPAPTAVAAPQVDVTATRAAIRSQVEPLQQCYERGKMDDARLKGTVVARLTVAPDGSIASVRITSSTLNSSQTEHCITGEIARWRLPKPSGGVPVSFSYPFVFE